MKSVLIVIDNLGGGGAEKVLITLLKKYSRSKYNVDLFLINKEGPYLSSVPSDVNIKWAFKPQKNIFKLYFFKILRRILLNLPPLFYLIFIRKKYDIEIGFREGFSTKIILSSANKSSLKLAWLHTDISQHHFWFINKEKYLRKLQNIDHLFCVSKNAESVLFRLCPEIKNKTTVIYNPIDIDQIRTLGQENIEHEFPVGTNLVNIGRLDKGKNQKFLIESVKRLREEKVNAQLWILGTGELESYLKNYSKELGVDNYVHFLGFVSNPYKYLAKSDLFVFSSIYEGLPTVLIEAMALDKNMVSTKCIGAEEILEEGKFGSMCTHNLNDFTDLIIENLHRGKILDFTRKLDEFDVKNQINKIEKCIDELYYSNKN